MTNGECPKCGSHEVYAVNSIGDNGILMIRFLQSADLTYLVCTKCGYTESYILDKSDLQAVAKKGQYVMPK